MLSPPRAAARPRHQLTATVRTRGRHRTAARRAKCALVTADAGSRLMRQSHAALLAMFAHLQRHGVPQRTWFPARLTLDCYRSLVKSEALRVTPHPWTRARFWGMGEGPWRPIGPIMSAGALPAHRLVRARSSGIDRGILNSEPAPMRAAFQEPLLYASDIAGGTPCRASTGIRARHPRRGHGVQGRADASGSRSVLVLSATV